MTPLFILQCILYFILFLCNAIFLGGINEQAQYGPKVCLLYVQNYRMDPGVNAFIFDATSSSCSAAITIASLSLLLGLMIFGLLAFLTWKHQESIENTKFLFALGITCTLMGLVMMIIASITTAGLKQTCSEFEKSTMSCQNVFANGFFANDPSKKYDRNLKTISAAIGAAWTAMIAWFAIGATHFYEYRKSSSRWW